MYLFYNRMEKEQPPDSGDRDLNISSTDDKIWAYEAVANAYHAGNAAGCLFESRISSRQPYFAGGGLPVGELGPDPPGCTHELTRC